MLSPVESRPCLSDHISLRIVVPQHCVRVVLASNDALISELKPLLPNPDATLIFNGTLLSDEHTLAFYRLQSNDLLVAVPRSSTTATQWMTITKDADVFTDSVNVILNSSLRRESLRLRDCVGWRAELRPHFYRRMESIRRTQSEPQPPYPRLSTVIPKHALDISSDPLPVYW
jgi:hypothetical protein